MTGPRPDLRRTDGSGAPPGSWRATTVGLLGAAASWALAAWLLHDVMASAPSPTAVVAVGEGVAVVAQVVAACVAVALGAVLGLGAVAAAPTPTGRAVRHRGPWWVGRAAALLLVVTGTGQVAGAATPGDPVAGPGADRVVVAAGDVPLPSWDRPADAGAGSAVVPVPSWERPEREEMPLPGWRPTGPAMTAAPPADLVSRGRAPDRAVVVRRGDTLWDIAARHLGPTATAEETAREWPRWYEANREVIGPEPDLILPGQRLVPPTGSGASGDRS